MSSVFQSAMTQLVTGVQVSDACVPCTRTRAVNEKRFHIEESN